MEKIKPIKVKIQNFQSIEDIEFEINGFTCMTGPTNIGKSATIRAISGALMGASVVGNVRKGKRFCTVELKSEDWSLKWEKGEKGINKYWIPFNAEVPLDKVGQKQLDQISDMGFGSIQVGSDNIQPWFADQFEPLFLLKKSGPAITNFISEITRLSVLQDAITINIRTKKRLLDASKLRTEDKKKLKEKLNKLGNLENLNSLKDDLTHQSETIKEYVAKAKTLNSFFNKLNLIKSSISMFDQVSNIEIPVDETKAFFDKYAFLKKAYRSLENEAVKIIAFRSIKKFQVPEISDLKNDIDSVQKLKKLHSSMELESVYINKYIGIKKAIVPEKINVDKDIITIKNLKNYKKELEVLDREIQDLQNKQSGLGSELQGIEEELGEINLCPTCERPIVESHPSSH